MPFGLIVGVNSHFQSVIFAGVLLREEKVENFEWVFREFVKMMSGKKPVTILTGTKTVHRRISRNFLLFPVLAFYK
jgi:hypothetical protein